MKVKVGTGVSMFSDLKHVVECKWCVHKCRVPRKTHAYVSIARLTKTAWKK